MSDAPRSHRLSPEHIAAARQRAHLSEMIGKHVALTRRGAELTGLCPFHQEKTPSFTVRDDKGFYHCFGCGAHGDAIGWRMQFGGESFYEAVNALAGSRPLTGREAEHREKNRAEAEERRRRYLAETALSIWHAARPIAGTPGEGYFRGRGITLDLPPTLRFLDRCLRGTREEGEFLPAVICAVKDSAERLVAVHRLYLDPASLRTTPRKVTHGIEKALLGSPGDGAIRLAPAAPSMGRCEGVETGLSIQQEKGVAVWSAISAGQMPKMWLPPSVEAVVTFADRDPVCWREGPLYGKRPGEHFAQLAAAADRKAGRRALIDVPPGNKADFNDVLQD